MSPPIIFTRTMLIHTKVAFCCSRPRPRTIEFKRCSFRPHSFCAWHAQNRLVFIVPIIFISYTLKLLAIFESKNHSDCQAANVLGFHLICFSFRIDKNYANYMQMTGFLMPSLYRFSWKTNFNDGGKTITCLEKSTELARDLSPV